jgi:mycoredoxin
MANIQNHNAQITMYTTQWCPDCWRAKKILKSLDVPFVEVDITKEHDAIAIVERLNNGNRSVPTILFPDGSVLTEPANHELMAKLQIQQ